ncbi:PHD finger protein rhinoceros-like isoform X2 [Eleutherodactylus coqui]|uniref:PHD finger protein rhinoceros-like isoform X2 n=1 Tax=Eleutherodactylus coqui TaxID=57060 RepID=UPI003461FEB9
MEELQRKIREAVIQDGTGRLEQLLKACRAPPAPATALPGGANEEQQPAISQPQTAPEEDNSRGRPKRRKNPPARLSPSPVAKRGATRSTPRAEEGQRAAPQRAATVQHTRPKRTNGVRATQARGSVEEQASHSPPGRSDAGAVAAMGPSAGRRAGGRSAGSASSISKGQQRRRRQRHSMERSVRGQEPARSNAVREEVAEEQRRYPNTERIGRSLAQTRGLTSAPECERGASGQWTVWIIGHSYVHWAEKRAMMRPLGKSLGLQGTTVHWHGIRGLLWPRLLKEVMQIGRWTPRRVILSFSPIPDPDNLVGSHSLQPGDWVVVKRRVRKSLGPRFKGPYQVLLTTPTSVKLKELLLVLRLMGLFTPYFAPP